MITRCTIKSVMAKSKHFLLFSMMIANNKDLEMSRLGSNDAEVKNTHPVATGMPAYPTSEVSVMAIISGQPDLCQICTYLCVKIRSIVMLVLKKM